MSILPGLINGGSHRDARGKIIFFNDFDMTPVKRFYVIEHPDTETVRAWQAHKLEQKWFYIVSGSFKVVIVRPDNWDAPSVNLEPKEFILSFAGNHVLHVPGNNANGFKALEPQSKMIVFSNFTVQESADDNFRFDKEQWYDWNSTK